MKQMIKCRIGAEGEWIYNFSMNLQEMVKSKNMSVKELSWKTKINQSSLRDYISGWTKPSDERIEKIAKALGCEVSELTEKKYVRPTWDDYEEENVEE